MPSARPERTRAGVLVLRQLPALGTGLLSVAGLVLVTRAVVPAAVAVASGDLIARLQGATEATSSVAGAVQALAPVAACVVIAQAVEFAAEPVRVAVVRQLDGRHRRAVEAAVAATSRTEILDDPAHQDAVAQASVDPMNSSERSPGQATWSQLVSWSRLLTAVLALTVVARDEVLVAVLMLVAVLVLRAVQRQDALGPADAWRSAAPERRQAAYWTDLLVGLEGAKDLRVYGLGGWFQDRYLAAANAHQQAVGRARAERARRQWLPALVVGVPLGVAMVVLVVQTSQGTLPVDRLAACIAALWAAIGAAFGAQEAVDIAGGTRAVTALDTLLTWPDSTAPDRGLPSSAAQGPLVLRVTDLGFRYADRPVLRGVSFDVAQGDLVALVGLNGAGKSTLGRLLAGLYTPETGEVALVGADGRTLGSPGHGVPVCLVPQRPVRLDLSLRDHIRLAAAWHDAPDDVLGAVRDAGIDDLCARLPDGLDTRLSTARTDGVDLSGGQWARIALARAMFAVRAGARVVIFDEPTAHLDVAVEDDVVDRIRLLARRACVVLVSHRLATVRRADRIVLLQDGRIEESGSHDELIAADRTYARLFRLQAGRFTLDADLERDDDPTGTPVDTSREVPLTVPAVLRDRSGGQA